MRARKLITTMFVLVLVLGLAYGGLNLAGAAGPPSIVSGTVTVGNDATSPLPVQQQGTANVNVTNSSLAVTQTPITGGGNESFQFGATNATFSVPQIASALQINLSIHINLVQFFYQGNVVAAFAGPIDGGPSNATLPLTRPIEFDMVKCDGGTGDSCFETWVGDQP
jgi:hypothetical protein